MELAAFLSMKDPGVVKHGWHQRFFTFDALRGERKNLQTLHLNIFLPRQSINLYIFVLFVAAAHAQ